MKMIPVDILPKKLIKQDNEFGNFTVSLTPNLNLKKFKYTIPLKMCIYQIGGGIRVEYGS